MDRNLLWQTLAHYGVNNHLIRVCQSLYSNCSSVVRTNKGLSHPLDVTSEVRQGCVLSPLLFITYIDNIAKRAAPQNENINNLLFADDQALIAYEELELQHHLTTLDNECKSNNMKINIRKTETMTIGRERQTVNITVDNQITKQVESFKYLGTTFSEDGKMDKEIDIRCNKANQVLGQLAPLLQHSTIPMTTKKHLIQSVFVPTLCYQCQTWTLTTKQKNKLVTTEMRCLRKALGVTRRDKIRNEVIREKVGVESIIDYIGRQQIQWFAHLERMSCDSIPYRSYMKREEGNRARGRPRLRWIDNIRETLQNYKLTLCDAARNARQRTLYPPRHPKKGTKRK